jgi:exopolysaccharide biosynthesis predicted pyruvyltransferase EpsI
MQDRIEAGPLIDRLQQTIKETLSAVIPAGPVTLVDYPNHANVGDSAIWLGETLYLEQERRQRPVYCCTVGDFSPAALADRAPEGPILLHGGGNFGTLWSRHQDFRNELLERFPGRPVIQLPQSIYFADDASAARTARAIDAHGAFTLLVRDQESYEFAAANFDCAVYMCPDMALYIGRTQRNRAQVDMLYLMRTDRERAEDFRAPDTAETKIVTDWLEESRYRRQFAKLATLARTAFADRHERTLELYTALAWKRYRRGVEILSQGRVVVTDRLHAHIISLLLDVPHVVLDNSYGKLGRFIDTWTGGFAHQRRASAMNEAARQARELL